eukprot:GILJ01007682.1.p1 GENE.GILJ01007682.1~~GILJ01007682.1.p1  ORF type:complete len:301 (+),score=30.09 GILJ01007682.1:1167-2069(+)
MDLCHQILRCKNGVDVLRLSGEDITASSTIAQTRIAYRKLAVQVHPDKLQGADIATKAFQALVNAYERFCKPQEEVPNETEHDGTREKKKSTSRRKPGTTLVRSNEGCYRTKIKCPKCRASWGDHLGGENRLPVYTHFMQGLTTVHCLSCLFEFGCLSATHLCPHCQKPFDYSPDQYHSKVHCKHCEKEFGFMLYTQSEAKEEEDRKKMRDIEERKRKRDQQSGSRQERAAKRQGLDVEEYLTTLQSDSASSDEGVKRVNYARWSVPELRFECKERKLKSVGKKQQLVARLTEHDNLVDR